MTSILMIPTYAIKILPKYLTALELSTIYMLIDNRPNALYSLDQSSRQCKLHLCRGSQFASNVRGRLQK